MIRALELPMGQDLLDFSAFLWEQGIHHRITEDGGQQVLWLDDISRQSEVNQFYSDWQSGLLQLSKAKISWGKWGGLLTGPLGDWKKIPVTLVLIVASLIVALITRIGSNDGVVSLFTMADYRIVGEYIHFSTTSAMVKSGEFWRLISPIFLHFGPVHLIFNLLWVLEFGRRIEVRHRGVFLLGLVLVTGLISNVVQFYVMNGFPRFGGMSGVIYGLIGFCWVREKSEPHAYDVPPGIYMFMLIWLVIGYTGLLEYMGFGRIANAAHAGGLLSGVACGWLYNKIKK